MLESHEFEGNNLPKEGVDLFDFLPIAERVAAAITGRRSAECFVVGLEGEWGSGKSSLLEMLQRLLEQAKVPVVRFEPWMVGSRDALIAELLAGIDAKLVEIGGETASNARNNLSERLKRYSGKVSALSRVAKIGKALNVPLADLVSGALESTGEAMKAGLGDQPLSTLKRETGDALAELGLRIVVLIDDIDRLEPKEAVEVLRLVQSAADFPHVTYVLCYDQERLHESVTQVTGLRNGAAYLEKFIQIVQPVPQPQPAALREKFLGGLREITGCEQVDRRLAGIVVDQVGHRLHTPRAVVRALDGLRLLWPALDGQVDLADLVWLQFVRARDVHLYRWIEGYVAEATDPPADEELLNTMRERFATPLETLIGPDSASGIMWHELCSLLPLTAPSSGGPKDGLLVRPERDEALRAYGEKRLSSPEHSRLYFGLLRPKDAMTDRELEEFIENCRSSTLIVERMRELTATSSRMGVSRLEVVLEQLGPAIARMDKDQIGGFVVGLFNVLDEISAGPLVTDVAVFRRTVSRLLSNFADVEETKDWSGLVRMALEHAQATDFLTSEVSVEKDKASIAWAGEATIAVIEHLAARFALMEPARIVKSGGAYNTIRIWLTADRAGPATFLDAILADDELLATFVKELYRRARDQMGTEFGKHVFLSAIADYFDLDALERRLTELDVRETTKDSLVREVLNLIREARKHPGEATGD